MNDTKEDTEEVTFCEICNQLVDRNSTYSCSRCSREICQACGDGWLCSDCILDDECIN